MAKKTVAAQLVDVLAEAGVRRIYGVAGDSLNGITDSIRKSKRLEWAHMRHEEVAAFAAGAEAHLTGRLAVCAGSCGPGNLHLINGLYDCHRSRVPVLAIAAQIPSAEIGSGYFQETHPEQLFAQCSHYCELVSHPDQLPRVLEIAIQTAISRRGVSVVVIPGDVALQETEGRAPRASFPKPETRVCPSEDELNQLAAVLNTAERPTILGGAGCAGAHDELTALAGKLKAPIVHALRGKEFIEYDNPFDVGMTGLLGFSSGYHAMMNCDVLLMLGTDFPYQQFFPTHAKVIQIDVRGEQLGRRARLDYGYVGDVKTTIGALLPKLRQNGSDEHLQKSIDHYRKTREHLDDLATEGEPEKPIHPQYVARVVDELAAEDAIFSCDVGTPTVWAARYLKMNGRRRLLGSFIVFRNESLAFVELEMKSAGIVDFATNLDNPSFAKIAEAVGFLGLTAKTPDQVRPMIAQAFAYDGPALVEAMVSRQELSMPPTITAEQAKGFSLFMLKAVLSGRGDEIVDLAKVNLFR